MTDLDQSPALPFDLIARGPTEGFQKDYSGGGGGGTPGGINTQIQYNNSGAFGGLTDSQVTARIAIFGAGASGAVPASGGGTTNYLRADGTFAAPPGGSATPGGSNLQIQYNNGGVFGGLTNVEITARIGAFTSTLSGAVPASGGGTSNFLRADGTFAVPPGAGLTDGDKGDITVATSGTVWTVDAGAITYAKIQNISATSRFLGRITAGAGVTEELTGTQATTLLDVFTDTLKGLVPASSGGTTSFLRADGTFAVPPSGGAGTPGGADTQIQYNAAGAFAGDNGLSYVVGTTTVALGLNATKTGKLALANGGVGGASITVQNPSTTVAYNFNLPIDAGTAGQLMQSGGGGATPMAWTATPTLGINASVTGQLILANGNALGTSVTVQNRSATSAYNFNLPSGPGVAGQIMQSQGGGTSPMVWTYTPTLGANASVSGQLLLANGNASGATVTVQNPAATAPYNFNLPAVAGVAGQLLQSQGGAASPMVWTATPTLGITGTTTGALALKGSVSGTVTLSVGNTAGSWTMKLPTTAGSANQVLATDGTGTTSWVTSGGGITGPGTTIRGATPVWATNVGGTVVDGAGFVNALAYGADPTDNPITATTTRVAIQDAINTGHPVYLPTGTYRIDAPINLTATGQGIFGDGVFNTFINGGFTTGHVVTVANNVHWIQIKNMTITRPTLASSGSGINFVTSAENDWCDLMNLRLVNHGVGIHFGGGTSWVQNVLSVGNSSHGIQMEGGATSFQWQLINIFSLANGGNGFHITGAGATPVGQWRGLATDSNGGAGLFATGIAAIRLSDSFLGNDASSGFYLSGGDTTHAHVLTNVYTEGSATGYGFFFDSGMSPSASMINCVAANHALSGCINNSANNLAVSGGSFIGNGRTSTAGNTYGILNNASGAKLNVMGAHIPVSFTQTKAIVSIAGTAACSIIGGNIATADITNSATVTYLAGNY